MVGSGGEERGGVGPDGEDLSFALFGAGAVGLAETADCLAGRGDWRIGVAAEDAGGAPLATATSSRSRLPDGPVFFPGEGTAFPFFLFALGEGTVLGVSTAPFLRGMGRSGIDFLIGGGRRESVFRTSGEGVLDRGATPVFTPEAVFSGVLDAALFLRAGAAADGFLRVGEGAVFTMGEGVFPGGGGHLGGTTGLFPFWGDGAGLAGGFLEKAVFPAFFAGERAAALLVAGVFVFDVMGCYSPCL